MAAFVLRDAYVSINATDISDWVKSVTLNVEVEEGDTTTMGATAKSRIGGLKDGSIALELVQDVAASQLDSIVWPLLGTVVAFEVRPTSAVVGTSNPKYTGSTLVSQWNPLGNAVGEVANVSVTWPTSGAVTRATA